MSDIPLDLRQCEQRWGARLVRRAQAVGSSFQVDALVLPFYIAALFLLLLPVLLGGFAWIAIAARLERRRKPKAGN